MTINKDVKNYALVTGNYWAFTLIDGALRMLVVLHFHTLGYSALDIALLFLFYEFFGVVTNLLGGWLGARVGLNRTMNWGLLLQVVALSMLMAPSSQLTVAYVMAAQALSGIAKDLNKMSAKSAIKHLLPAEQSAGLYRWIAILTGSKNALKGFGFFLGGVLLATFGFQGSMSAMAAVLAMIWLVSSVALPANLGKAKSKPKFNQLFAKTAAINWLSAARLFLFAARDVWFVVALPVYLITELNWAQTSVGSFLACWIIGYGLVQGLAPKLTGLEVQGWQALIWALPLSTLPAAIALLLGTSVSASALIIVGLLLFGALFAVNSSLHSYLIVRLANRDGTSLDVGFYYMANAMGRLLGTVLSGGVYVAYGLEACLWISAAFIALAALLAAPVKVSPE